MGKMTSSEEARALNPIDDLMFRKMAEDVGFCEEILRVILEDNELKVLETIPQWTGTNLQGRSVILDAKCVKSDGRQVNIEVQKEDDDDHQRRVRYNGAILTTNISEPGTKFKNVPDVCIVFISKFDIFKGKSPIYHVDRVVRETGAVVDNGFEEIYVNTKVRNGSDVSELMRIFVEDNAYSTRFPKTSEIKRRYKIVDGGGDMGSAIERFKQEGRTEGQMEVFDKLLRKKIISYSEAADMADMTEEDFKKKYDEFIKENTHASEEQL